MAPIKRSTLLQNAAKQAPVATPKLQNNRKDKPVLIDKTNQISTVRALRNRKIYPDSIAKVSKDLFKNGVIHSQRGTSKRSTSTKKLTVPQKSSECFVALEKVDEANIHKMLVYKDTSPSSAEKQNLTKKLRNAPRKGLETVNEAKVNKDMGTSDSDKQTSAKSFGNAPQKTSECAVLESINETKKHKLVYKDVSPSSAEKEKTFTPAKKKLLYDFKGGSSGSDSSRIHTRRRKPVRKRIKPRNDTSDEENCDVQNVTKKMKMLTECSQLANDINSKEMQDCTYLHSHTLHSSMNSSVQPLREQNTFSNLSMKSETRKFFKTPMRKELIEMNYFNYTNQKKKKFTKSSKALSRKKESSRSYKTKQKTLRYNSYDTSSKLPVQPVLNENRMQSKLCNNTTNIHSKIPETNSNIIACNMKSGLPKVHPETITAVADKTKITNNKLPVKPVVLNENRMQSNRSNTATVSKIPVLKPTTSSAPISITKSGLEQVHPQKVVAVVDKTQIPNVKTPSCTETCEVMDTVSCAAQDLSTEETAPEVPITVSQINYKRGGTTFGLDFTLGDSKTDCSTKTDNSAATNQVQDTLPAVRATNTIIPARAAPPVGVIKQPQTLPSVHIVKQPLVVRNKTEDRNYFTGPVRSFDFHERYPRNGSRRHRVEVVYVPAAPSTECFTLENYFGFDEEPEEEFTLSPLKRHSDTNITAPPLTSTPHISNSKKCNSPKHNRLTVKPKLKECHHKANASISASQNNCSQILAGGGCGYKKKTSAVGKSKTATFAVPQLLNVPACATQNKKAFAAAGISMAQSSITDYMQSASDVPFETSLSNIEGDELSVTRTEPPRRSYEKLVRKRRHVEFKDYTSEEEEVEQKTKTLSKKYNRSKRAKRSKKQEKIFEKWASNVSSQFEEIDSIALIVE